MCIKNNTEIKLEYDANSARLKPIFSIGNQNQVRVLVSYMYKKWFWSYTKCKGCCGPSLFSCKHLCFYCQDRVAYMGQHMFSGACLVPISCFLYSIYQMSLWCTFIMSQNATNNLLDQQDSQDYIHRLRTPNEAFFHQFEVEVLKHFTS